MKTIILFFSFVFFVIEPVLSQGVSVVTLCSGDTVQLESGVNGASQYTWYPSTGLNNASIQKPLLTLTNTASAAITYTYQVQSMSGGNISTETVSVIVNPLPVSSDFTFPNTVVCAGTAINFTATATNGFEYQWNFGDGKTDYGSSVYHSFFATGDATDTFDVSLSVYDNLTKCFSPAVTKQVTIKQGPDASVKDYTSKKAFTQCGGSAYNLVLDNTSATTNTNYEIDWGDGSPVYSTTDLPLTGTSHQYLSQGYFQLKETVTGQNGCVASKTTLVFNGSNPAITLSNLGSTVGHCVPYDITIPITGIASNPSGTTYTFTSNSGDPPVTYEHDLLPANYTHTFTTTSAAAKGATMANSFYIKVKAENPCGVSYSTIEPITTSAKPKAGFKISPDSIACVGTQVIFQDTSNTGAIVDGIGIVDKTVVSNWVITPATGWSISSGKVGSVTPTKNPATWGSVNLGITFKVAGTYSIKRIVRNDCGGDSITKTVCIQSPITSQFSINTNDGCSPVVVQTQNTSSPLNQCEPSTFKWNITYDAAYCGIDAGYDYIDNTSDSSKNPKISFNKSGIYTLSLSAINECGAFPVSQTITVKTKPSVALIPIPSQCGPAPILITPQTQIENCGNTTLQYLWNFGGGNPASSTVDKPTDIAFAPLGQHAVSLQVSNECGDSLVQTSFTIFESPVAKAEKDTVLCIGADALLTASATKGTVPYTYLWTSIPGGIISSNQQQLITPKSTADYELLVTDSNNCSSTSKIKIIVNPLPEIKVDTDTICEKESATLTATGADTYVWETGASSAQINVTPSKTTNYKVVGVKAGCVDSVYATVIVNPLPIVNAGIDTMFCNQPLAKNLLGFSPLGGEWSGSDVSISGIFTPTTAGVFSLVYSYSMPQTGCVNSDTMLVTSIDPQVVDAGMGFSICENAPIAQLVGFYPANGKWTGKGIVGETFNPQVAGVGLHVLTYSYGVDNCITSDTIKVTVNAAPQLSVNNPVFCVGDSATISVSGADSYSWSPVLGLSSVTGSNVIAKPIKNTIYSIIGTNTLNSCSDTIESNVTVHALPTVEAGIDQKFCNQNIPVQLNGFSPSSGGLWTGSGVATDGLFNPSIANLGLHKLFYSFTDANQCSNKDSITITVVDAIFAKAGDGFSLCADALPVQLQGFSPVSGGVWTGNGLTNIVFNPQNAGIGVHTLTYSYGSGTCLTSDTINITVHPLPVIDLGKNDTSCINSSLFPLKAYSPIGGKWSGSGIVDADAGMFNSQIAGLGLHTLTYKYTNQQTSCSNQSTKTINVGALPKVAFSLPSIACSQTNVLINNTTSGATIYLWNFGDGKTSTITNPTPIFDKENYYNVSLIAKTDLGCVDSAKKTVEIIDAPKADFTQDKSSGCGPFYVTVTNLSKGKYLTYSWNFGTGDTSNLDSPLWQKYQQGVYDTTYYVSLTIKNQCGISIHNDSVLVFSKPGVSFGASQTYGCSPVAINFIDNITGMPDTMIWDFGDGSPLVTSTKFGKQISHPFYYVGETDTLYTIRLKAWNECGIDSLKQKVTIHSKNIKAFFTVDTLSGCEPLTEHFVHHSGKCIVAWDFGDGNVSNAQSPEHTFTKAGTYVVKLAVNNGCSYDTAAGVPITVLQNPIPQFSFTDKTCSRDSVIFTQQTNDVNSMIWNFGDGTTSDLTHPLHKYGKEGTYQVSLTIENASNCMASKTMPLTVLYTPKPSFTVSTTSGCSPLTVSFDNNTDKLTDNTYIWKTNNGSPSILTNPPSKTYINTSHCSDSVYTVMLIANNANCIDTAISKITVHPIPQSDFSTDNGLYCGFGHSQSVQFKQQSKCADQYQWLVNYTPVSLYANPLLNFNKAGENDVSLVVENQFNCKDTVTKNYKIYPEAQDIVVANNAIGCEPLDVPFSGNNTELSYVWTFGDDGSKSTEISPVHTFLNAGDYSVSVTLSASEGCTASLDFNSIVKVNPQAHADFSYEELNPHHYTGDLLFFNNSDNATKYYWNLGDSSVSYASDTLTHKYKTNSTFQVQLIATNKFHCADTIVKSVQPKFFAGLYIPNAFSPNDPNDSIKYFRPIGFGLKTFHIQVYDTWGNLIWESSALDEDGRPTEYWNGKTSKGDDLPMDAYVWKTDKCIFKDGRRWEGMEYGNKHKYTGSITLIR